VVAQLIASNFLYVAESAWIIKSLQQDFPDIRFHYTSEFKREMEEAG